MQPLQLEIWSATRLWRNRIWIGLLAALVAPLLSMSIRVALGDALIGYPFITFFPAVLLTALIGNRVSATLATLVSAVLASKLAVDSAGSFIPQSTSAWIGIGFFLIVNATIITLIHWLYQSLDRLDALNSDLERRVELRTKQLAQANAELVAEGKARQLAEAQFRQAQKMQAVGQLAGGIAHDFNNMLAIIISGLDLAKRRMAKGNMDVVRFIDNAMDGAGRAATLTQRLLSFSRRSPLSPATTDLSRLVRGMEELLRRTLGEAIELEFVLGGAVWPATVDAGELENAILNLAVNARDAMPSGGRLTVETLNAHLDDSYAAVHTEVTAGQYAVVAVTDSGVGMPSDIAERAFEPFFTTKPPGAGTGLGLSQVYGFVKQSGGHVKIYSEPGVGTTVKIYLPRAVAGTVAGSTPVPDATLPAGSPDELVVVVEDEIGVRRVTVDTLRELGYTVRHAASGDDALKLLGEVGSVTLLLTDIVMPGMSGRQLADAAKTARPDLKVLYVTGYTRNAIVHNGVVDSDVELLMKPFTVDQLARKVRRVIGA